MDKEYLAEKLNSIRNELSHVWGGIFVIGGGAATLLSVSHWTIINMCLFIIGIILTITFINAYIIRKEEMMNMLKEFKEYKNEHK